MTAWEAKREVKLVEWQNKIQKCRSSGMTVTQWCREQGINSKTYYRWEREVLGVLNQSHEPESGKMALTVTKPEFAAIEPASQTYSGRLPAAILRCGDLSIEIQNGADSETIRAIIAAVRSC